jgi:hypothetical protein
MADFNAQQFITQARAKGVPDEQTYKYLQTKGLIPTTNTPSVPPSVTQPKQPTSFSQSIGQGIQNMGAGATKVTTGLASGLTQSEQSFGTDLGQSAFLKFGGQKQIDQISQQDLDSGNSLMSVALKAKDPARKQHLLELATQDFQSAGMTTKDILGEVKSNEQILGDAAGVLVDILSAGSYGEAAKGMEAGKLSKELPQIAKAKTFGQFVGQGAKTGAKIGAAYGGGKGAADAMSQGQGAEGVVQSAGTGALLGAGGGAILGAAGGTVAGVLGAKAGATAAKTGKALEDIINTPEEQVYKLSSSDRKYWFANQHASIEEKQAVIKQQAATTLKQQVATATANRDALEKELATSSRETVIGLRPKFIKVMGEQSATYRQLVDEEIADKKNIPISSGELGSFIDAKYADDPITGASIKNRMGLPEDANAQTTIGQVFDKTRAMRKGIGTAAVKGSRTYTSDEKLTDDSVNTLLIYLKSNGVDLSEANKFWAEYAPVRDQFIREAKPFLQVDIGTKQLANTLTRVAKGQDPNNENFINEVQNLVGEDFMGENKRIVRAMDANKKVQVINQEQALETKLNAETDAKLAQKKLTEKEYQIETKANRREAFKKTLGKYGIIIAGTIVSERIAAPIVSKIIGK